MHSALLLGIILAYFALLLGIAFYTSRNSNNDSFFIGNRSSKWWLVAFGMVGTSLSGMTFISVPGTVGLINAKTGLPGALGYFQVVIGYFIGYFVVAYVLLPLYYRLQLTSIYTYLEQRLGVSSYKTGALFFILSRTLGATLRLYLVIKVLEKFVLGSMGVPFWVTAVIILGLILLYTYRGGVKTIVWTDTLQTTFMLLALGTCVVFIMRSLHIDVGATWQAMRGKGLTHLINTNPLSGKFFGKEILGGAFITIAMTGLDQEMMQKNISVRRLGDSQKNMIVLNFLQAGVVFIFLMLGGLLYLYAQRAGIKATGDDLFPTFAMQYAPFAISVCFLIGLISALFPSADGALTALTSSFCIDILGIKNRSDWSEKQKKQVRLAVHGTFALLFLVCVFVFKEVDNGSLIQTLLVIAGYTYGPLLALFVFGIFTKRSLRNWLVPVVCIVAPCACYALQKHDGSSFSYASWAGAYVASFTGGKMNVLQEPVCHWIGSYIIGNELLVINAGLTFIGLLLCSRKLVGTSVGETATG